MTQHPFKPLSMLISEPFRFFFPFALIYGVIGVMKWPVMFMRENASYPGANHAFLMSEGFFGGFIMGFSLTALPRLMESSKDSFYKTSLVILAGIFIVMNTTLSHGPVTVGNGIFLLVLLVFGMILRHQTYHRTCLPPPGFILFIPALGCAALGAGLYLLTFEETYPPFLLNLRPLLLYQAWPLLPFLGVCPFFLPKFTGEPCRHDLPDAHMPSKAWKQRAWVSLILAVGMILSMVIEAAGWQRSGLALRAASIVWFLRKELPSNILRFRGDRLIKCLSLCVWALPTAYLLAALLPAYRIAWVHWSMVGGLSALTLLVATRVILGHSGRMTVLRQRSNWIVAMIALIWVGMVSRVSGDVWPKIMQSHYIYGAICWIAGIAIWVTIILPKVFQSDEPAPPPKD